MDERGDRRGPHRRKSKTLPPLQDDDEAETTVAESRFREALRLFASGVTIITAPDGTGGVHGMTATAFSSLSLQPPLILVAVSRSTRCHRHIASARRFGVSILDDRHIDVARHFGKQGLAPLPPEFVELSGVPVVADAFATLACVLHDTHEGGDHSIFVGRVLAAEARTGSPLLHYQGRYRHLQELI